MIRSEEKILEFISKFENQEMGYRSLEGACCKCEYKGNFPLIATENASRNKGFAGIILRLILLLFLTIFSLLFIPIYLLPFVFIGIIYFLFRFKQGDNYDLVVCPNCFAELCEISYSLIYRYTHQSVFTLVTELKINDKPATKEILEKLLQHFKTNNELKKYIVQNYKNKC